MLDQLVQRWTAGWRGLALAGLVALVAALPGVALPVIDREEARTAQATAQMLESGDFIAINFQDQIRQGQSVGVYWPQAAAVAVLSDAQARDIWPYRLPSLVGAVLAAVACAWGAAAFWGDRTAALAGAAFGTSLLASVVGSLATADALAAGCGAGAMAALARLYAARQDLVAAGRGTKALFWIALTCGLLAGGWCVGAIALLTGALLFAAERQAAWARTLGWSWGLMLVAAVLGPWVVAITVATDGGFWSIPAHPRVLPLGARTLGALAASYPLLALVPAAGVFAWRHRSQPGVRFALAWLAAAWLLYELRPAANVGDALFLYPPLAWLAAAGWRQADPVTRRIGAGLALVGGVVLLGAVSYLLRRFGEAQMAITGAVTLILLAGSAAACAVALLRRRLGVLLIAGGLIVAGQGVLLGVLIPNLPLLWPSQRVVAVLQRLQLDPTDGLVQGPVTVAGYDEPSLVFALGAQTEFADARAAARAVNEGRPAIVEASQGPEFARLLARYHLKAQAVATVRGLDYAENRPVVLTVWRKVE